MSLVLNLPKNSEALITESAECPYIPNTATDHSTTLVLQSFLLNVGWYRFYVTTLKLVLFEKTGFRGAVTEDG